MIDERAQLEKFLDRYDDLACVVVEDQRPNDSYGLDMCNQELVETICDALDWDGFSLFDNFDFEEVVKLDDKEVIRAYCFLAFLRMDLFWAALNGQIGDPVFNKFVATYSEYWFKRLLDRYNSLYKDEAETKHGWIH
jgi:hypothetical protein